MRICKQNGSLNFFELCTQQNIELKLRIAIYLLPTQI